MRRAWSLVAAATAAIVAAAGCVTADGNVLLDGTPLASCDQVPGRTSDDQACTFAGVCVVPDPTDPMPSCCQTLASCDGGTLSLDRYCEPGCTACLDDTGCPAGRELCDGNRCTACPDPTACPPCPAGLAPLVRNGCTTCTCAPPSQCDPNTMQCSATGEECYPGMVCTPGCTPSDPSCCANVCAAPGCPSPAPLGCDTTCDPTTMMCSECVTGACACLNGRWSCTAVCGTPTGMCFQPAG